MPTLARLAPLLAFLLTTPLWAQQVPPFRPTIKPRVTMPIMAQAPTIDGVIGEGEWRTFHSARFVGGKDDMLAERAGEFWVGTDGQKLFVAVRTAVHPVHGPVTHQPARQEAEDAENLQNDDVIEIWVSRTAFGGRGEFQVMLTPAGAVFDAHHEFDMDLATHKTRKPDPEEGMRSKEVIDALNRAVRREWTADMTHAHTVKDGVWVAEVAIDLKQLGLDDLTQPFSLRVCRNFQLPREQCRWAPGVLFFGSAGTMPLFAIDERAPIVSEVGFQDAEGLRLAVDVTNPGENPLTVEVRLNWQLDREQPDPPEEHTLTLPPGETRRVELVRPLTAAQVAKGVAGGEIRVRTPRRGVYFHRDFRWRLRPAGPLWAE